MRTLTADEALANATYHHRLTEDAFSVEEVAAELVGLHNTSPVSPFLSVLARLPGFQRSDLEGPMWSSWRLVRFRAMRLTMFVFPLDLLEVAAAATRRLGEALAARWLGDSGLSRSDFDRLAAAVEEVLADGPLTVRGMRRLMDVPQSIDLSGVVGRMCDVGRIVGGAPPRNWRSSVREYHLWQQVLPEVDLHHRDEAAATRELIHRYVRSYGPVTLDDISWWTGFPKGRCAHTLEALDAHLEEAQVAGWRGPLYHTTDARSDAASVAGVKALPLLDPYVQGYRDRERFLDPARTDFVYDGGGNSAATVVHRGRIIGVWQVTEKPTEAVRYHLFAGTPASVAQAAEAELAAAGLLYFDRPVDVVRMATMEPLSAGGGRSASHPLDGRPHRASQREAAAGTP